MAIHTIVFSAKGQQCSVTLAQAPWQAGVPDSASIVCTRGVCVCVCLAQFSLKWKAPLALMICLPACPSLSNSRLRGTVVLEGVRAWGSGCRPRVELVGARKRAARNGNGRTKRNWARKQNVWVPRKPDCATMWPLRLRCVLHWQFFSYAFFLIRAPPAMRAHREGKKSNLRSSFSKETREEVTPPPWGGGVPAAPTRQSGSVSGRGEARQGNPPPPGPAPAPLSPHCTRLLRSPTISSGLRMPNCTRLMVRSGHALSPEGAPPCIFASFCLSLPARDHVTLLCLRLSQPPARKQQRRRRPTSSGSTRPQALLEVPPVELAAGL